MHPRTALVPLALAALLVVAGCSGPVSSVPNADAATAAEPDAAPAANGDGGRTVTVSASGTVEASPDRAVIEVAVTATADDVSTARRRLAENVSSMRAGLADAGIESSAITTRFFDISRDRRRERPGEPRYRARHAFVVTVEDPDRVGEVIVAAVENGATEVDRVQFTLTKETRRELRREAIADAMANARSQADTMAESAGLRITRVDTVSNREVGVDPFRREVALAGGGDAGTSISGGPVTVTAQVQVAYNATAAD